MKFSSRAAARTRSAVSARTGCGTGPGDRPRETVAMDTPAARATSAIVATSAHANSAAENAAQEHGRKGGEWLGESRWPCSWANCQKKFGRLRLVPKSGLSAELPGS